MGRWRQHGMAPAALVACLVAPDLPAATQVVGNGVYQAAVADTGEYTAGTAEANPADRRSLLFASAPSVIPGKSFNTIRCWDTDTDYRLTGDDRRSSAPFTCRRIDEFAPAVTELFSGGSPPVVGVRTTWTCRRGTDEFTAVQEIAVEGSNPSDSVVRVTLCVTNDAPRVAAFGLRFVWDWYIDNYDAPFIGVRPPAPPTEPLLDSATDSIDPASDLLELSSSATPYSVPARYLGVGTVTRPVLALGPTPPELVRYSRFNPAAATCFDYAFTPGVIAGPIPADAVVTYYWGATPSTSIQLAQGESFCATQYLFTYTDTMPELCQVRASLVGGAACGAPSIPLDASASVAPECSGGLDYRFLDPDGAVARDWSPVALFDADRYGTWAVETRCDSNPACLGRATADVLLEAEPVFTAALAEDQADCGTGLLVSWDAATFASGSGVYHVYRSQVSCLDALASAPLVMDVTGTSWLDSTVLVGTTYFHAVVAEDAVAAQVCTARGPRGGAATTRCAGSATDVAAPWTPEFVCWGLRVGHDGNALTLDWTTGRPLQGDEHSHVWKAVGSVAAGFALASPEGWAGTTWTESDASAARQFFDVRAANACEVQSEDDEPPGIDPPAGINCP